MLQTIKDHGAVVPHAPAGLTFADGTFSWGTCNGAQGWVHITAMVMYVTHLTSTHRSCLVDQYFHRVLLAGGREANSWFIDGDGHLNLVDPTNRIFLVFQRTVLAK
jgi:hypothetical protein